MQKLLVELSTGLLIFLAVPAGATHKRGELVCGECHYAHENRAGQTNPSLLTSTPTGNEVCLVCHDDREGDASGAPTVYSIGGGDTYYPGGDFDGVGDGGENGHFKKEGGALLADDKPATAPGGNDAIRSADLACWSCHDPHNRANEASDFRLLRLRPRNATTGEPYVKKDIRVVAAAADYRDESGDAHTVYHSGISEWCAACHGNPDDAGSGFHGTAVGDPDVGADDEWRRHPTGVPFSAEYAARYAASDDSVTPDWAAPFEDNGGDWRTDTAAHDPAAGDRVMCLSCHRAHVGRSSSGEAAVYHRDGLRWAPDVPMGRDSGCNKCHGM